MATSTSTNREQSQSRLPQPRTAIGEERVFDPVCGMSVDPNAAEIERIDRNGTAYYFCSSDCKRKFEASPEEYAA